MREITLKTANRPTTVSRAKVRKAVQEVFALMNENEAIEKVDPPTVIVTNRMPAKTRKK